MDCARVLVTLWKEVRKHSHLQMGRGKPVREKRPWFGVWATDYSDAMNQEEQQGSVRNQELCFRHVNTQLFLTCHVTILKRQMRNLWDVYSRPTFPRVLTSWGYPVTLLVAEISRSSTKWSVANRYLPESQEAEKPDRVSTKFKKETATYVWG